MVNTKRVSAYQLPYYTYHKTSVGGLSLNKYYTHKYHIPLFSVSRMLIGTRNISSSILSIGIGTYFVENTIYSNAMCSIIML